MDLTDKQKYNIEEIGKKFNLKLLLIYGSYARGTNGKMSDLDVAYMPNKKADFETQLEIYSELAGVFGDIERELDAVCLQEKDSLFIYQVSKNSQLIYGNLTDYNEFRAFAFRNYMDSKDLRELEEKLVFKYQDYLNKTYAG
jgi:predicted nucleotidyltransferase